ncbi:hypothetical protein AAW14_24855 [Streptomyces hygroscopicus]|uniref:hypothetical protein n=1 Tax=Streptomyces hygroscopicus TaxID=1912 RepID=UPI00223F5C4C|nr:hypothetical protein [Streptomyces hygroscopicus]MCW7945153.1 hypothetical protein [Streptomyces hygroscopicus]
MCPKPNGRVSARSSSELNDRIRALWQRAGGRPFTPDERAEYKALVVEWAAAIQAERSDVAEAA